MTHASRALANENDAHYIRDNEMVEMYRDTQIATEIETQIRIQKGRQRKSGVQKKQRYVHDKRYKILSVQSCRNKPR